ncbi:MAG: AAA family ATPase [Phenylobacterium sp.]|uniref:AAA family ATPase n=1 Tax=Phenylobacterium sp. TaxID=1871053 RepID=UPI0025E94504|nr:AAA family ATPase [Phenylobacterium sp.]MBA4013253.1 AAA family ATPase [Phenylobacterium sp.]
MPASKPEEYRVHFARAEQLGDFLPGDIVISPSRDRWNDFGFRIHVDIVVHARQSIGISSVHLDGYLGFIYPDSDANDSIPDADTRLIARVLDAFPDPSAPADQFPQFFTMLPDMAAYRTLVGELGPEEAAAVLVAMHDMVEAEYATISRPWSEAEHLQTFQRGFLRSNEAYFALKNAGPLLQGLEFEPIGRISDALRIEFQLDGRPNPHAIEFRFDIHEPVLPKRFAVLIGVNGVGKSQTLGRIAAAALRRGSGTLTDGVGMRPQFNRLLAFSSTAATLSTFPTDRGRRPRVWYRRFSLNDARTGRRGQSTADLIVQLARSDDRIGMTARLELFLTAITAVASPHELALLPRRRSDEIVHLDQLKRGGEQDRLDRYASIDTRLDPVRATGKRTYRLSSGEQAFIRFAALASLYIENSSLLLLDEPETHLHPTFISRFVALLDSLLAQTGSAAIIATHSVYFAREAFEDQVLVLRSDEEGRISVETPALNTFGADVGAISYFVFGEDEPSRLARAVEARIANAAGSWDEVFAQYRDQLSLEMLGEIRVAIEERDSAKHST